jgi:hypothetical protein
MCPTFPQLKHLISLEPLDLLIDLLDPDFRQQLLAKWPLRLQLKHFVPVCLLTAKVASSGAFTGGVTLLDIFFNSSAAVSMAWASSNVFCSVNFFSTSIRFRTSVDNRPAIT